MSSASQHKASHRRLIPDLSSRRTRSLATVLFSCFASLGLAVAVAAADTISVPVDQPTIQDALDVSTNGDTIVVEPGVYFENIVFDGHLVTIQSTDPADPGVVASTIIDAGTNGPAVTIFDGEDRSAVLDGLTIRNGAAAFVQGAGINIVNSSPTVRRCIIESNVSNFSGGGIGVTGAFADPLITRNVIRNNQTATGHGGGISINSGSAEISYNEIDNNTALAGGGGGLYLLNASATVVNNVLHHNDSAQGGGGIFSDNSSGSMVRNNTIADNVATSGAGGLAMDGAAALVTNCILWGNGDDLSGGVVTYCTIEDGDAGTGNTSADPMFVGGTDYHLTAGSGSINAGDPATMTLMGETDIDGEDRIMDGRIDVGADEFTLGGFPLTVESSPELGATILLQPADTNGLSDGVTPFGRLYPSGTTVTLSILPVDFESFVRWQIDGVNQPLGQAAIQVTMDAPHTVTARFVPGQTYSVACDGSGDFMSVQAAINAATDGDVIAVKPCVYYELLNFEGKAITVQGLDPDDPEVVAATEINGSGSGTVVRFDSGETPDSVLRGLTIANGSASTGGGIYMSSGSFIFTNPTIEQCVIRNNAATSQGGGLYMRFSSSLIRRNIIENNTAPNGAGVATADVADVADSNPIFEANIFRDNVATGNGGAIFLSPKARAMVRSNVIAGNSATLGDGIYSQSNGANLFYNTIADNAGEGVNRVSGAITAHSNIFWGNVDDLVNFTATYSIIEDADAGTGNLALNPRFVDRAGGVYNILPDSPGIDAGDPNVFVFPDETDIDGALRKVNGRVDMGADEVDTFGNILWVTSTPQPGADVDVTPADLEGRSDGTTHFFRSYASTDVVSLNAPTSTAAGTFRRWVLDGVNQAVGNGTLVVLMNQSRTARAEFLPNLVVTSNVAGVNITVDTADIDGLSGGATDFVRVYPADTSVTVTAPTTAGGFSFVGWQVDGVNQGAAINATVLLNRTRRVNAVYATPTHVLTVDASQQDTIQVSPQDTLGDSDGVAPPAFTRTYNEGQKVTLTASANSCTALFDHWELDSVPQPGGQRTITVDMDADHSATAVFDGSGGTDCNANGLPDDCDIAYRFSTDCNANNIPDECDIASGTSFDCDANGLPDECEEDCNGNRRRDVCDIAAGTSGDCNSNGVPDECDISAATSFDCQPNEIPDECEADCNRNGIDDACELAAGSSPDCNNNSIPDECDTFQEFLEEYTLSPINTSTVQCVTLVSPVEAFTDVAMTFSGFADLASTSENIDVRINDVSVGVVYNDTGSDCPLVPDVDQLIVPAATFNNLVAGGDAEICLVPAGVDEFCTPVSTLDLEIAYVGNVGDCNLNDIPDDCDIAAGTSADCNANAVPDECDVAEMDCNENGFPDDCDVFAGTSLDCNANVIPDECDIEEFDCNTNGLPDDCDIAAGSSPDCNTNGIPDECDIGSPVPPGGRSLLIAVSDGSPPVSQLLGAFFTTVDTFTTNTGTPTLTLLQNYDVVLAYTNTTPSSPTGLGNVLADYVDAGGAVVIATYGHSTSFGISGRIDTEPGLDPLKNSFNGSVSGSLNPLVGDDAIWEYPNAVSAAAVGYFWNSNFARPNLDAGATLIADDGNGVPMIAINQAENVIGLNLFPSSGQGANNAAFFDLLENACARVLFQGSLGTSFDCNSNGVPDECDIDAGTSIDCDVNGVPDECDPDCNTNGVTDACDISFGTSLDCNTTGVPDSCELIAGTSADCNTNGIPDDCDISGGFSADCNTNGTPDECELSLFDCNNNALPDDCDVAGGSSPDCNSNGLPDECDIASGTSPDCQVNGIPDECEPDCNLNGSADDCDVLAGTSVDCNNNLTPDECELIGSLSASSPQLTGVISGTPVSFTLVNPPASSTDVVLDFTGYADFSASSEYLDVTINGAPVGQIFVIGGDCPVTPDVDQLIVPAATYNAALGGGNATITMTPSSGVNFLCSPDSYVTVSVSYEALGLGDCNTNGVPDDCDLVGGTSADCNLNDTPDECEDDCNTNGVPDDCDLAGGASMDCNLNAVPDECDLAGGTSTDCNTNGIPDDCDIAGGFSLDCNTNGTPDECEITVLDCNQDGIPDDCDIAAGSSADCNANGIPDECDVAAGSSADCQMDGVPDECEPDCNTNGVADGCDIFIGTSFDCDTNSVPDECDPDCNTNGTPDACDIAAGTSPDCNTNGLPDECDLAAGESGLLRVVHSFPMDADPGWLLEGLWAFGVPGGGNDPTGGFTGQNVYGYNLAGNYTNSMPTYYLTTTPLDCRACSGTILRFRRWLGVESSTYDHASIQVSNNGVDWLTIFNHVGGSIQETAWSLQEYDISATADDQQTVYVRWGMGPTDTSVTYGGWNIDDVEILAELSGDCNSNGIPDECDIAAGTSGDCNNNLVPDECDISFGLPDLNSNGVPDVCEDCNSNGIPDDFDIAAGTSTDCNFNGLPDECEPDCNANGVADGCDIAGGTSIDCDSNGVPDECENDCNNNGITDGCDLLAGTSGDCNFNGIPDECDLAGFGGESTLYAVQRSGNTLFRVNPETGALTADVIMPSVNGSYGMATNPLTGRIYLLIDGNPQALVTLDPVTGATDAVGPINDLLADIAFRGDGRLYGVRGNSSAAPGEIVEIDLATTVLSPTGVVMGAGNGQSIAFQPGTDLLYHIYTFPQSGPSVVLSRIDVDAQSVTVISSYSPSFQARALTFHASGSPLLEFGGDGLYSINPNTGVRTFRGSLGSTIVGAAFTIAITDCNLNLIPDECDIAAGTSFDCNTNALPDECEADCNGNGNPDDCDIAFGFSEDCNSNALPDECDIASGFSMDVNSTGVPDECETDCNVNGIDDAIDIAAGTSDDCNLNSVPDECELDAGNQGASGAQPEDACADAQRVCPGNTYIGSTVDMTNDGIASCASSGASPDAWYRYTPGEDGFLTVSLCGSAYDTALSIHSGCPGDLVNQILCNDDFCDLQSELTISVTAHEVYYIRVSGYSGNSGMYTMTLAGPVCGADGTDCNSNGILDECDVAAGTSQDCNSNALPDSCDIAGGESQDLNNTGVPDECENDCNLNGIDDVQDVSGGTSLDCNSNSIPDECEQDCNSNGIPDDCDIASASSADCNTNGVPDECELPVDPSPADGAALVPVDPLLTWSLFGAGEFTGPCCTFLYAAATGTGSGFAPSTLYTLDLATAAPTPVGPIGFDGVTGLSFAPDGTLYATCVDSISGDALLITVDPVTGAGTPVGLVDTIGTGQFRVPDISFRGDGVLYGFGESPDQLITIDTVTGQGTAIGSIGFGSGGNGLDFSPEDVLYATPRDENCMVVIDPVTGAGACVPGTEFVVPDRISALEFCPQDGTLYGAWNDGNKLYSLVTIDPQTGMATVIGSTVAGLDALAFPCAAGGGNPDCPVVYDVYFGTDNPPTTLLCAGVETPECDPGPLMVETTYYWQVVVSDCCNMTVGPVWSFTTTPEDCNGNGVADDLDISGGTSQDCNTNAVPDECDIAAGTSVDCDSDGVPDDCAVAAGSVPDCNSNGVPDACDILAGTGSDCDTNGLLDGCELAAGSSADCNTNGVPDACDLVSGGVGEALLYGVPGFEPSLYTINPLDGALTLVGMLDQDVSNALGLAVHPQSGVLYAIVEQSAPARGLGGPPLRLLAAVDRTTAAVAVIGPLSETLSDLAFRDNGTLYGVGGNASTNPGEIFTVNLSNASLTSTGIIRGGGGGQSIAFRPGTNQLYHAFVGGGGIEPTRGNDVSDNSEIILGTGDVLERINVDNGLVTVINPALSFAPYISMTFAPSGDVLFAYNFDQFYAINPDNGAETSIGASATGITGMSFFVTAGAPVSVDCDSNGIPDECEEDCNTNGVADACDIAAGTSVDANGDGIPDECPVDCNTNGVPDDLDIAAGTSADCNTNGVPDECDISSGASLDCNGNSVPDECEAGVPGDSDGDGDVDVDDYPFFAECLDGPNVIPDAIVPECGPRCLEVFDFDEDDDVDLADFAEFQFLSAAP